MSTDTAKATGEFSPESTYFDEREQRLTAEIEAAQTKIKEATVWFETKTKALVEQREVVLVATGKLLGMKEELDRQVKDGREAITVMTKMVAENELLLATLADHLAPAKANLDSINAEIASLERQRDKKSAKPKHDVESLEARLSRLKLRRTIAMRKLQASLLADAAEIVEQVAPSANADVQG